VALGEAIIRQVPKVGNSVRTPGYSILLLNKKIPNKIKVSPIKEKNSWCFFESRMGMSLKPF